MRIHGLLTTVLIVSFTSLNAHSVLSPVCPASGSEPSPAYAQDGNMPAVSSWRDLEAMPDNCGIELDEPAEQAIALAAQFSFSGNTNELAERLGAISETQGLRYWSVSAGDWRKLVSKAVALESNDKRLERSDFTSQDMLSGQTLYFAQDDTSSWGTNVYAMRVLDSSEDTIVLNSFNVSAIRVGPIKVIRSDDAQSVLFLNRLDDSTWQYYSLALIKRSVLAPNEKSLINRQYAFFRFLIGDTPDAGMPLAP